LERREEQVLPGSGGEVGESEEVGGEIAQTIYAHMNN
jgi:hypothetical protein